MMDGIMQQIDLDKRFNDWFNENEGFALRAERFYEDLNQFATREAQAARMYLWLKSAYEHGAMVWMNDNNDT